MKAARYLELLTRRAGWTLAIGVLVAMSGAWLLRDFRPVLDASGLLPEAEASDDELRGKLEEAFREPDRIVVVLEGGAPLEAAGARAFVETMARALSGVEGVARVEACLTEAVRRYAEEILPRRALLFFTPQRLAELGECLGEARIAERLGRLAEFGRSDPLGLRPFALQLAGRFGAVASPLRFDEGYFADRSGRRRFLLLEPRGGEFDLAAKLRLVDGIDEALARLRIEGRAELERLGARIFAVGRAQAHAEGYRSWSADARRAMAWSLALIYLVFALSFRRPLGALFALLPIALGIEGALLLGRGLYGDVHLMTGVFCVLLVGLGIDFAFHFAAHYWFRAGDSAPVDPRARLVFAIERPFRGILLGGLTTAAAFLALTASRYPVIRQTGVIIAGGIVLLLLASWALIPAVLRRSRLPSVRAGLERESPRWLGVFPALASRLASRPYRRAAWFLWALLILAAGAGVARLRFSASPREVFAQDSHAAARIELLTLELGLSFDSLAVLSRAATPEEALEKDREFFEAISGARRRARIALVESLAAHLPSPERQRESSSYLRERREVFDASAFARRWSAALETSELAGEARPRRDYADRILRVLDVDLEGVSLAGLPEDGLGEIARRHLREVDGVWYAATWLYPREHPWIEGKLDPFRAFFAEWKEASGQSPVLLGGPLRLASHREAIRRDALAVSALAALLVSCLLAAGFRSLGSVLRALAPVSLGVWLLAGFLGAVGVEIHILTLAALPILFGIGVDDGVHLVERLRRQESLVTALTEAGPGLFLTSVTTASAFASMLLAENRGIRELGLAGAVGVMLCLLSSLTFLPLWYAPRAADQEASKHHEER